MRDVAERVEKRNDRRSRRTRRALEEALVALMLEKRYDEITVQEIIDRADVGRSTFYAHYLDKEDLLHSEVTRLVDTLAIHMDRSMGAEGTRIVPSLELLRHVDESRTLIRALVRGRAIDPALKTMQGHLSHQVEIRLAQRLPKGQTTSIPLPIIAQHVAGTLMTLFQWWLDRDMVESAEQLDDYFLQLVRPSVLATTGILV